jgi:hypothetical protein
MSKERLQTSQNELPHYSEEFFVNLDTHRGYIECYLKTVLQREETNPHYHSIPDIVQEAYVTFYNKTQGNHDRFTQNEAIAYITTTAYFKLQREIQRIQSKQAVEQQHYIDIKELVAQAKQVNEQEYSTHEYRSLLYQIIDQAYLRGLIPPQRYKALYMGIAYSAIYEEYQAPSDRLSLVGILHEDEAMQTLAQQISNEQTHAEHRAQANEDQLSQQFTRVHNMLYQRRQRLYKRYLLELFAQIEQTNPNIIQIVTKQNRQ